LHGFSIEPTQQYRRSELADIPPGYSQISDCL